MAFSAVKHIHVNSVHVHLEIKPLFLICLHRNVVLTELMCRALFVVHEFAGVDVSDLNLDFIVRVIIVSSDSVAIGRTFALVWLYVTSGQV